MYYWGKKLTQIFCCNFFLVCGNIILKFLGSQEGFLSFKIFCTPYTAIGEEIVFLAL